MSQFLVSGPKFTGLFSPNAGGIVLDHLSFRFWISSLFLEIFPIKVWSCLKSPQILHIWPQFFEGQPPNFGTCIIKFTDHVAKFHGDRPRKLGDRVAKYMETSRVKH